MTTTIPINHHAYTSTFTECTASASKGAFFADAEMVDPLAVSTGLEFSYVSHVSVAAAETASGCIEIRVGRRSSPGVD